MPTATPTCLCPMDSKVQLLYKINNNLALLFKSMSAGAFVGDLVTLVGNGCGCSELQILAAINNNLVKGLNIIGLGTPDTIHSRTNDIGDDTIIPLSQHHLEIITLGGAARTSRFALSLAPTQNGSRLQLRFVPAAATANIVVEVHNDTPGGTLIYTYTTDGSGTDIFVADLYVQAGAWHSYSEAVPVV